MCCCQKKPLGGDWYRSLLLNSEWFQSHRTIHLYTVFFLDILLYLFYTFIGLVLSFIIYLLCVGIGFPIVRVVQKDVTNGDIWGLGFIIGFAILFSAFLIIVLMFWFLSDCQKCINNDTYLSPSGVLPKSVDKIEEKEEVELSSSIQ